MEGIKSHIDPPGSIEDLIHDVTKERDENRLPYAKKTMIRCGLAMQVNGLREIRQRLPHLQTIIAKYCANCDGGNPEKKAKNNRIVVIRRSISPLHTVLTVVAHAELMLLTLNLFSQIFEIM